MWRVFCLELRVAFRHGADIAGPLWFFLMVITLFPLSIGPQPHAAGAYRAGHHPGGGAAGLAAGAGAAVPRRPAGRQPGAADAAAAAAGGGAGEGAGPLDSDRPAADYSLPLVALLLGMDVYGWKIMALTLLLGTPALGFLAAPGVGLTAGLRRGGVLLGILVLPLSIPVLIFAAAAMDAASMHLPVDGYLAVLGALLAGSATLSPFATAAALRISVQ